MYHNQGSSVWVESRIVWVIGRGRRRWFPGMAALCFGLGIAVAASPVSSAEFFVHVVQGDNGSDDCLVTIASDQSMPALLARPEVRTFREHIRYFAGSVNGAYAAVVDTVASSGFEAYRTRMIAQHGLPSDTFCLRSSRVSHVYEIIGPPPRIGTSTLRRITDAGYRATQPASTVDGGTALLDGKTVTLQLYEYGSTGGSIGAPDGTISGPQFTRWMIETGSACRGSIEFRWLGRKGRSGDMSDETLIALDWSSCSSYLGPAGPGDSPKVPVSYEKASDAVLVLKTAP